MSQSIRVATWNVNSIRMRHDHLLRWLELRKYPEIVCLQETKVVDADFPRAELEKLGYQIVINGQKSYNGVCILSKFPIANVTKGFDDPILMKESRVITAEIEGLMIVNVYIPNGEMAQSEKYIWKFEFLKALEKQLGIMADQNKPVLVCGDFNIAPEDVDVWGAEMMKGLIMFTDQERNWLRKQLKSGWTDLFRKFETGPGFYSWFDYRTLAYDANRGWRIDFLIANKALEGKVVGCKIDREPRGWEKPSDHCPVVAKITLSD